MITFVQAHPLDNRRSIYCSEASDIGWGAGVWPVSFYWNGILFNRGAACLGKEDELLYVAYVGINGDIIKVWND
jgi:hypothetical protein